MADNSRLGISVNLPSGATYDLLILDAPDGYPEGKIDFALNDTPRKITGIEKVAQLFLKILFTTKGSDIIHTSLGTNFSDYAVNANRTGVDQDLYASLTQEIKDAEGQCKIILNTIGSDVASMLELISILGLDTGKDYITMFLYLQTRAGIGAQVAVPFPQLDMVLSQG